MEPEAKKLLGHGARDLLAPLWTALAEALAGQPYAPDTPRLHAAYAWIRAGRYPEAHAALESTPEWQRWPGLLIAHAETARRLGDLAAARRDWSLLCWGFPAEAERVLAARDLPDDRLRRLWLEFTDLDLDLPTEDFPAWLLVADPGTAAAVPPDLAPSLPAGDVYRLLHQLVAGADGIPQRKALGARHPDLLKLYLAALGRKSRQ